MKRAIYIFLLFALSQFVAGLCLVIFGGAQQSPVVLGVATFSAELLLIAALWGLRFTQPNPWRTLAARLTRRQGGIIGAFVLLSLGLSLTLTPFDLNDLGMTEMFKEMAGNPLCLLGLCVIGPLAEEMVFREGILREMVQSGYSPRRAILMSAVCFGVVHGDPMQAIPAVVLGVALGWLYCQTGDMRLCLPAHIINNVIAALELKFPEAETFTESLPTVACAVVGLGLMTVAVIIFYKLRDQSRNM